VNTTSGGVVAADPRASFLIRTYLTLLGAICWFILFETALFRSGAAEHISEALLSVSWLVVLGAFMLVAWLAAHSASTLESTAAQCAALAGYVCAEALLFVPLLYHAELAAPGTTSLAAVLTVCGFGVLTLVVFVSGRDFSFLRSFLMWAGLVVLALIVASEVFGFQLPALFAIFMIGYAGVAVLYDTSDVLHHFPTDRHVAAALELFASIALLFWYVIQHLVNNADL
jgi:FtsH-binding integral membrane protein